MTRWYTVPLIAAVVVLAVVALAAFAAGGGSDLCLAVGPQTIGLA